MSNLCCKENINIERIKEWSLDLSFFDIIFIHSNNVLSF